MECDLLSEGQFGYELAARITVPATYSENTLDVFG